MKSPGRRAVAKLLAPRLVWDSSKLGPAGRFAKPYPTRRKLAKRKRRWIESGGTGRILTRRLIRYGGLEGISDLRKTQLAKLAAVEDQEMAQYAREFLAGHPLRVLNVAPWETETWAEYFGWEG